MVLMEDENKKGSRLSAVKIDFQMVKCPYCHKKNWIKYGYQGKKQIFYCNSCNKKFVNLGLKYKTYNPKVIVNAITYYNKGGTLKDSVKNVNKRYKINVSITSVHSWIKEFSDICTYNKLRSKIVKNFKDDIISEYSFKHSGLTYNFIYHIPKVKMLCKNYPRLISFLENMKNICPSDIFQNATRCSQINQDIIIDKKEQYNHACRLAGLALSATTYNKKRHDNVEKFMLFNDSSTIACEVPVWFWEKNIDSGICGHIDILQVRNNKVYILDFKPNAHKENEGKVASQLYNYASGMSFRTKIPLSNFYCAWFDENMYYEFQPIKTKIKMKN